MKARARPLEARGDGERGSQRAVVPDVKLERVEAAHRGEPAYGLEHGGVIGLEAQVVKASTQPCGVFSDGLSLMLGKRQLEPRGGAGPAREDGGKDGPPPLREAFRGGPVERRTPALPHHPEEVVRGGEVSPVPAMDPRVLALGPLRVQLEEQVDVAAVKRRRPVKGGMAGGRSCVGEARGLPQGAPVRAHEHVVARLPHQGAFDDGGGMGARRQEARVGGNGTFGAGPKEAFDGVVHERLAKGPLHQVGSGRHGFPPSVFYPARESVYREPPAHGRTKGRYRRFGAEYVPSFRGQKAPPGRMTHHRAPFGQPEERDGG